MPGVLCGSPGVLRWELDVGSVLCLPWAPLSCCHSSAAAQGRGKGMRCAGGSERSSAVPGPGEGQPHTSGRGMVPLASPSSMEIRASSRDTNQPEAAPSAFLLNVEMKMWV